MDLAKTDQWAMRQKFSVVVEKTARKFSARRASCLKRLPRLSSRSAAAGRVQRSLVRDDATGDLRSPDVGAGRN